ncbi:MAG: 5-methyltetrahydropteroyltriglutamate--homocysteine S-methyltransferase [Rhodospirillaceae bacterium]|nr:5-methyltetrahydropteroyltriglutamate--homocysteine S-methyltransferase [Rhodospirillaceae bacterium]
MTKPQNQFPFRAEQIGSLVRPEALLAARNAFNDGRLDAEGLGRAEDAAIIGAIKRQEEIGLGAVSDGEFRRSVYSESFTAKALSGVEIQLTEDTGWSASNDLGHRMARRVPQISGPVRWKGSPNVPSFEFLKSHAAGTGKVTLPGPAFIHYRAGRANISAEIYPDLDKFWSDLTAAYHAEMQALAAAGCTYLQIDETAIIKLGDERVRGLLTMRGDDWRDLLDVYMTAINAVVRGAPDGLQIALHVCRSSDPNWQADAGYDVIADALFNQLDIDCYLLEYEGPRAGDFEPLALCPKGKRVVLGLVSTMEEEVESAAFLKSRLEDAGRFIPMDQLGLSPRCGFATSAEHQKTIPEETQWQKLARITEVARDIWG